MRIISGEFRGRVLLSPVGTITRPITDKVKLALFNSLGAFVDGAAVVDLFCGTGSLGLEAISRGARTCCFAEADRQALDRLARNVAALGVGGRATIWRGDILRKLPDWLAALPGQIDLAFVDPPYRMVAEWSWPRAVDCLFRPLAGKLAPGGQVVLRVARNIQPPTALGSLTPRSRRDYGGMSLMYLVAGEDRPNTP